jgi:methylenetetrahydrofolate reductase (NADPH)
MLQASTNSFQKSLENPDEFTITYELVPGRGSGGKRLEKILSLAHSAKDDGRIKAFSITDNPGGHPALSPTSLGLDIQKIGVEPLLHFSLKDKNRNMAESQLFECHHHDLLNLLVLGGDYPRYGFKGQAMPVFDLDSTQLLSLIHGLRHHSTIPKGAPGQAMDLPKMDFFAGCVVSPFKTLESEQVWQYIKLLTKIQCGARFVISQLGYDILKYEELKQFCTNKHISIPIIANVFVPSLGVARIMNRGRVPGVLFPDALLMRMEEEAKSADRGEEARLLRAAAMIATLRHMGYSGIHLGGNNLNFEAISFLLDTAQSYYSNTLSEEESFPEPGSYYLYNTKPAPKKRELTLLYSANALIHRQVFGKEGLLFPLAKGISLWARDIPFFNRCYSTVEHIIKKTLFRCRMCGDCTLAESSYLCPQSGCPKRMINGPCGGSNNGFCEVYPGERLCFWVRSYHRGPQPDAHHIHGLPSITPKDWSLNRKSSWLNYFSGKDHCQLETQKKAIKSKE